MSEIKEQVQNFIHKYLDVETEAESIIADYALQTWQPLSQFSKYLLFIGDVHTGKTRAGEVMAAICNNPFVPGGRCIGNTIINMMDEMYPCVLILDEGDNIFSDRILSILRNGGMKGRGLTKITEVEKENFETKFYNIYGYKVIVSLRRFDDNAIQSKCITIKLTETKRNEIPCVLSSKFEKDSAEIRQALSAFYAGIPVFAL